MDIAAGRGFGGVDVGMGVDPDEANLFILAPVELGDTGDGSRGDGVIATQDDRRHAFFEGANDHFGGPGAGLGDFVQIACVPLASLLGLGDGDGDVAAVVYFVAEGLQAGFESGDADG